MAFFGDMRHNPAHPDQTKACAPGRVRAWGENIANWQTPQQMIDFWMGSTGHRANIHNPAFNSVGIAAWRDSSGQLWATVNFAGRSEEHTSELQSLMRISYAVFCLKKKNTTSNLTTKS